MRNLLPLFLILLFVACQFDSNSSNQLQNEKGGQTAITDKKKLRNWTCVPGKQVGLIKAGDTEAAIIATYGQEYVSRKEIGVGEGEVTTATVLFPDTKNEMFITWKPGKAFTVMDAVTIEQATASWQTSEGISTGTTLDELVKINGKDFQFHGFEWDYSGMSSDWQGGKISKHLTVFLEPTRPDIIYPDLLGAEIFSSSHPKAKAAGLKVRTMVISFE